LTVINTLQKLRTNTDRNTAREIARKEVTALLNAGDKKNAHKKAQTAVGVTPEY
jgi:hypothetical protein